MGNPNQQCSKSEICYGYKWVLNWLCWGSKYIHFLVNICRICRMIMIKTKSIYIPGALTFAFFIIKLCESSNKGGWRPIYKTSISHEKKWYPPCWIVTSERLSHGKSRGLSRLGLRIFMSYSRWCPDSGSNPLLVIISHYRAYFMSNVYSMAGFGEHEYVVKQAGKFNVNFANMITKF